MIVNELSKLFKCMIVNKEKIWQPRNGFNDNVEMKGLKAFVIVCGLLVICHCHMSRCQFTE